MPLLSWLCNSLLSPYILVRNFFLVWCVSLCSLAFRTLSFGMRFSRNSFPTLNGKRMRSMNPNWLPLSLPAHRQFMRRHKEEEEYENRHLFVRRSKMTILFGYALSKNNKDVLYICPPFVTKSKIDDAYLGNKKKKLWDFTCLVRCDILFFYVDDVTFFSFVCKMWYTFLAKEIGHKTMTQTTEAQELTLQYIKQYNFFLCVWNIAMRVPRYESRVVCWHAAKSAKRNVCVIGIKATCAQQKALHERNPIRVFVLLAGKSGSTGYSSSDSSSDNSVERTQQHTQNRRRWKQVMNEKNKEDMKCHSRSTIYYTMYPKWQQVLHTKKEKERREEEHNMPWEDISQRKAVFCSRLSAQDFLLKTFCRQTTFSSSASFLKHNVSQSPTDNLIPFLSWQQPLIL